MCTWLDLVLYQELMISHPYAIIISIVRCNALAPYFLNLTLFILFLKHVVPLILSLFSSHLTWEWLIIAYFVLIGVFLVITLFSCL